MQVANRILEVIPTRFRRVVKELSGDGRGVVDVRKPPAGNTRGDRIEEWSASDSERSVPCPPKRSQLSVVARRVQLDRSLAVRVHGCAESCNASIEANGAVGARRILCRRTPGWPAPEWLRQW